MLLTREKIELLRDITFRRTSKLQVRSINDALDFVNSVGFCFAFKARNSELPCLWHAACGERDPVYPQHTHHDPYISLVWEAKDILPAEKKIYYGKALKNRPSMISLDYLPFFYRLLENEGREDAFLRKYLSGNLSQEARAIMDALTENSPQVTADLKLASGLAHPQKRAAFDRAMAELQMNMFVTKIAEFYDPFTFLWDLFTNRYKDEIKIAGQLNKKQAQTAILQKYFTNIYISHPNEIKRLFGWSKEDIDPALQYMLKIEFLQKDIIIKYEKNTFYGLSILNNL